MHLEFELIGILGLVWYLIVSIPDLCTLTYFHVIYIPFFNVLPFLLCFSDHRTQTEKDIFHTLLFL